MEGEQREPVRLPAEVFEGLEDVRRSGRANMHDRYTVQRLAYELGHHATVLWIEENPRLYARGMLYGFECGS
jgi:hypothetical protein